MASLGVYEDKYLPVGYNQAPSQYTSISQASGVIPVAAFCGALNTFLLTSGATALTTPAAAAIYQQYLPTVREIGRSSYGGMRYTIRIANSNAGTLTITADSSITTTGTLTIASGTWREFVISITSPTTANMQGIGSGTYT